MRIALLYFPECPNWREAGRRLGQALAGVGQPDTEVNYVPVTTDAEARALRFAGSPTFLVDGTDLFGASPVDALSCRLYATAGGVRGLPELPDLVAALRERTGG